MVDTKNLSNVVREPGSDSESESNRGSSSDGESLDAQGKEQKLKRKDRSLKNGNFFSHLFVDPNKSVTFLSSMKQNLELFARILEVLFCRV